MGAFVFSCLRCLWPLSYAGIQRGSISYLSFPSRGSASLCIRRHDADSLVRARYLALFAGHAQDQASHRDHVCVVSVEVTIFMCRESKQIPDAGHGRLPGCRSSRLLGSHRALTARRFYIKSAVAVERFASFEAGAAMVAIRPESHRPAAPLGIPLSRNRRPCGPSMPLFGLHSIVGNLLGLRRSRLNLKQTYYERANHVARVSYSVYFKHCPPMMAEDSHHRVQLI